MVQKNAFTNIQTALSLGNASDEMLGGLVIVSALVTEFALAEILFEEADKIDAAENMTGVSIDDLVEIDNSVARVLEQVCCIEKQINEKIRQGRLLRNGLTVA